MFLKIKTWLQKIFGSKKKKDKDHNDDLYPLY